LTEAEWRTCDDPAAMLDFLRDQVSGRKLRLFACACVRSVGHLLPDGAARRAVETAERYADGLARPAELAEAHRAAVVESREVRPGSPPARLAALRAHEAAGLFAARRPERAARLAAAAAGLEKAAALEDTAGRRLQSAWGRYLAVLPAELTPLAWQAMAVPAWRAVTADRLEFAAARNRGEAAERARQCDLLRDLIGNPFRPAAVGPHWLAWNDRTIPRLARALYDEKDFDNLPILGDALEDAGCDDADILRHCRKPGRHVRGCWVLDLLLGKE
jgi:hypothetical protein